MQSLKSHTSKDVVKMCNSRGFLSRVLLRMLGIKTSNTRNLIRS